MNKFFVEDLTAAEIHPKLLMYKNASYSLSTVKNLAALLKSGHTSPKDDPCENSLKTVTPPQIIQQVHDIVR